MKLRRIRRQQRPASEAQQVCYEAYQVVGSLLSDLGRSDTPEAGKILDNLSQARLVHKDVLPWESHDAPAPVPLNPVPAMDLDQFAPGERAVSIQACENYARLVVEAERERCAKLVEAQRSDYPEYSYNEAVADCAAAIRKGES